MENRKKRWPEGRVHTWGYPPPSSDFVDTHLMRYHPPSSTLVIGSMSFYTVLCPFTHSSLSFYTVFCRFTPLSVLLQMWQSSQKVGLVHWHNKWCLSFPFRFVYPSSILVETQTHPITSYTCLMNAPLLPFLLMSFHFEFILFHPLFVSFEAPNFAKLLQIGDINFNSF